MSPQDRPGGYHVVIATPDNLFPDRMMACHETHNSHCIGWLVNQVGDGNNIGLRIRMSTCKNADQIRLRGKQHATFEDTLP